MEFNLEEWGDGTIRLVYWDAVHGEDIIFILGELGMATRSYVVEDGEKWIPVENLVLELRRILLRAAFEREKG